MGIVLPDSILNNPGLKFIRRWLLENTRIVASIDLPKETFAEGGGVPNPSVLVVQKLTRNEVLLAQSGALNAYDIFMAIPKKVGINKRGNPEYVRNRDGFVILDADNIPARDDDLPRVAATFAGWVER